MTDSKLTHQTYKFVDEKEADALAWIFIDDHSPMKKVAIKLPELKPDEVRAKVLYTGLCHSDVHNVRSEWGPCAFYPVAPGHEIVAEITQVGSHVTDYKAGERIGIGCQRDCCEQCGPCRKTLDNLCTGKLDQRYTYGPKYWGGYATVIQQPAKFCFKIPKELPEERVPPLFCAGVTTYAPIARYAKPGQEIAVLGIGGLGHLAVQYAKAWGCKVTAFTSSQSKKELVKELGADRVVDSNEESYKEEAGKFDVVLNTLPVGDCFELLVNLAGVTGVFVQLGLPPRGKTIGIDIGTIVHRQIVFTGSSIGSRKEIREMLEFSAKHKIVPLCEQFDFDHFPEAFERLEHGKPIFRCVVNVSKASSKEASVSCL